ncbi:MAG: LysE family transporter [Candidatus Ratteibacteria bacterium]|nr:LysE family transporter [Candidatus Ratteibacteria bacterium]
MPIRQNVNTYGKAEKTVMNTNYISIFLVSFTIALTGALAPGPLLTLVIAKSLRQGVKAGPIIIAGHAFLEIIMVSVLVLGLGNIIDSPIIIKTISIAGALILLCFGIRILYSLSNVSIDVSADDYGSSAMLFFQGITISIANPYWVIWWLTLGLGLLLSVRDSGIKGLLFFFTGHILADLLWYSFVSYSIGKSKRFISQHIYRTILVVCALAIILFGVYFGISAFI